MPLSTFWCLLHSLLSESCGFVSFISLINTYGFPFPCFYLKWCHFHSCLLFPFILFVHKCYWFCVILYPAKFLKLIIKSKNFLWNWLIHGWILQILQRCYIAMLFKFFKAIGRDRMLSYSFMEASIALIAKMDKDPTKKKSTGQSSNI